MLVLSAKFQKTKNAPVVDTFRIRCSCGCAGEIKVLSRRGQNVRIGFEFPESMKITRNAVTAENVFEDSIQ